MARSLCKNVVFQNGGPSNVAATFWPRFEAELEHEMNVKERELDWLQKIGSDIQPRLTEDQQQGSKRRLVLKSLFN